ncbi:MAG TPA: DUF2723 domain-containing protein [Phycisphaerae bacterium]|nr:DUF2723 domain-containing protein [Phycisphaerae bacterium]
MAKVRRQHGEQLERAEQTVAVAPPPPIAGWRHALAIAGLAIALGAVYFCTLQRGVSRGDSAELQYLSPLLGICHPPGYAIEILFGYLASLMPFGPDVAYRLNALMAVCGIVGCLALYGTVRRTTGLILPGLVAAGLLGFSSIYWSYSTVAEEYVFHGAFLLIGAYAAVRFVSADRAAWLWVAAITVGISTAGRPSELLVLPAFLGLWFGRRRSARLGVRRLGVAVALYLVPLVFSIGYFLVRDNPRYVHARDGILADEIVGRVPTSSLTGWPRLKEAAYYTLGLSWAKHDASWKDRLETGASRYANLLGGTEVISPQKHANDPFALDRGGGAAIGLPGLVLAVAGIIFRRRQYGWVLLGLGLFVGNFIFFIWHQTWDALTFTVPGLAGLALLGGLGAAGPPQGSSVGVVAGVARRAARWRAVGLAVGGLTVAGLAVGNYRLVNRSQMTDQAMAARLVAAMRELPRDSVMLTTFWPAMTFRYSAYVGAGRTDIRTLAIEDKYWTQALAYAREHGLAAFVIDTSRPGQPGRDAIRARTPRAALEAGLVQVVYPPAAVGQPPQDESKR